MQPQQAMQPPGAAGAKKSSGLATAALVLGIIGLCLWPLGLVGLVLGIVALVQMGKDPTLGGRGMAIAGIVLPLVAIPIMGIMAAIAIPNFIRFQARAKQAECRSNLKAVYVAEKAYYAENNGYVISPEKVSFNPERGNRYAYFLSATGDLEDRSGPQPGPSRELVGFAIDTFKHRDAEHLSQSDLRAPLAGDAQAGVTGTCPECEFTAVCIGNVDNDPVLDVWSISTAQRTSAKGEIIPPGEPSNDVDDIAQ